MEHSFNIALPVQEPVLVFSVALLLFLLAPMLMKLLRLPAIFGLILGGMLLGPHALNVLDRGPIMELFATIGIFYIMFIAGVEIDFNEFRKSKYRSLFFGFLCFLIPQLLGSFVTHYYLGFSWLAAVLLGSAMSTHTLLSYPIASKLGLSRNEAVAVAVGGTLITDTLALLVVSVVAGMSGGELELWLVLRLVFLMLVFTVVTLLVLPRAGRWIFRNLESEGVLHYVFVLTSLFLTVYVGKLFGVEPVLSAFLAGLALNRLIPHTSALMNRILFAGNALFIPFFMVSIGMMLDLNMIFDSWQVWQVAATLLLLAVTSKWLAAWFTQLAFSYSSLERTILFGLTISKVAAALAVVMVGTRAGLLPEMVVNAIIMLILTSSLLSSLLVEKSGRRLVKTEHERKIEIHEQPQKILVSAGNPDSFEKLIDLAIFIREKKSAFPVYALSVVADDDDSDSRVLKVNRELEKCSAHAAETETPFEILVRIDPEITTGISRAARELLVTDIILGWKERPTSRDLLLGSITDNLLQSVPVTVLISRLVQPLNNMKKLLVAVPAYAELDSGFGHWLQIIKNMAIQTDMPVHFYGHPQTLDYALMILSRNKPLLRSEFHEFTDWKKFFSTFRNLGREEMLIVVQGRPGTPSEDPQQLRVGNLLSRNFKNQNFILLCPEQKLAANADRFEPFFSGQRNSRLFT